VAVLVRAFGDIDVAEVAVQAGLLSSTGAPGNLPESIH
jgi:hypothetical protein